MLDKTRRFLFGLPWDYQLLQCAHFAFRLVRNLGHRRRPGGPYRFVRLPCTFDRTHGVETAGTCHWRRLGTGSWTDAYGASYIASPAEVMQRALKDVPDPSSRTFVDLGCGKGRALIVASAFPFKAVMGVEKAPELARIASANAGVIRKNHPDRPLIEVITADVIDFTLPPGDLVLYLARPFWKPVMKRVIDKIEDSLGDGPRRITVIYYGAFLNEFVDRSRRLVADPSLSFVLYPANEETVPGWVGVWHGAGGA